MNEGAVTSGQVDVGRMNGKEVGGRKRKKTEVSEILLLQTELQLKHANLMCWHYLSNHAVLLLVRFFVFSMTSWTLHHSKLLLQGLYKYYTCSLLKPICNFYYST